MHPSGCSRELYAARHNKTNNFILQSRLRYCCYATLLDCSACNGLQPWVQVDVYLTGLKDPQNIMSSCSVTA